jgi:hypothetical protein
MLLAQFGPAEWIGIVGMWITILGGVIHVVWKLSSMDTRLAHVETAVAGDGAKREKVYTRLDNHEVRIVKLEAAQEALE